MRPKNRWCRMHDFQFASPSLFLREKKAIEENGQLLLTIMETIQHLKDECDRNIDEKEVLRILKYLDCPTRPFREDPVSLILETAYDLTRKLFWLQYQRNKPRALKWLKPLSQIVSFGISPILEMENKSLLFGVYSQPKCPVLEAYDNDVKACEKSCRERSRAGIFTNPLLSRLLNFYHPKLKIRLYQFRPTARGTCIYQIVME